MLILIIAAIPSPLLADASEIPLVKYNNSDYGIELSYPENWSIQDDAFAIVSFLGPPSNLTGSPEVMFNVVGNTHPQGRPNYEDFSIEQFKAYVTQLINFSMPHLSDSYGDFEFQILDAVKTTTDKGYPAFKLQYMINGMDPSDSSIVYQFKRLQIWIPQANNLYGLQYDAEPSKFSAFLPIIQKMINSFEITNVNKNLSLYKTKSPQFLAAKEKMETEFNNSKGFIASSRSMEPYLYPNDLFLVSNSTSFNDLSVGDVIAFKKPSDISVVIVGRIIDVQSNPEGERTVTTKGDANPSPIPGTDSPIKKENYIGKVVSIITHVQN
jgi:signal peptidase I